MGKYVLIDFGAIWCIACRMQSPFILKAYNDDHLPRFKYPTLMDLKVRFLYYIIWNRVHSSNFFD
jgi:thiol:disulfide interchange protein